MIGINFVQKIFYLKLVRYFWGTMRHAELSNSGSYIGMVCEVKMLLLAVFLMLSFSVFWRLIVTIFFHCLNVDGEKLW